MKVEERAVLLKELGMDEMAKKLLKKKGGKTKLLKAMEGYRYATEDDIQDFREEMLKFDKELCMEEIKNYDKLPPDNVLADLKKAKKDKCFDEFYVAYLRKVKDPILFGKIKDFPTLYFYISQWGDDVNIEDIIGTE